MATRGKIRLMPPSCRYCGRQWYPPEHVSANVAFCSECKSDRLAKAASGIVGLKLVLGLDGTQVVVPVKA